MKADPEMRRKAGRYVCVVCGDRLNETTVSNGDPFCKTACANGWHGFVPMSQQYTLSGHRPGHTGHTAPSRWDDGARHRARRQREREARDG